MTKENKTLLLRIWGAIAVFFAILLLFADSLIVYVFLLPSSFLYLFCQITYRIQENVKEFYL